MGEQFSMNFMHGSQFVQNGGQCSQVSFAAMSISMQTGGQGGFPQLGAGRRPNAGLPDFSNGEFMQGFMEGLLQSLNGDSFSELGELDDDVDESSGENGDDSEGADEKGKPNTQGALQHLFKNFDKLDKDHNGVLDADEIQGAGDQGGGKGGSGVDKKALNQITDKMDELIFASVDPGDQAWFGLTRKDLSTLIKRQKEGENLDEIAGSLRGKISTERGVSGSKKGFANYVRNTQLGILFRKLFAA